MPYSRPASRGDLPISRNPLAYCGAGTKIPVLPPPPSNFSDRGVRNAELGLVRPSTAVLSLAVPAQYPLQLQGVAPADQVPIREVGTRPKSAVRAYVSSHSKGAILYQGSLMPGRPVPKPGQYR